MIWVDGNRLVITGNRIIQPFQVVQGFAAIIISLGKIRLDVNCLVITGDGFVQSF